MKRINFIFIGLITLILSLMLVAPKTKALTLYDDYNGMVVSWDDMDNLYITYFDYDGTSTLYINKYNILDSTTNEPLLVGYELQEGIKLFISNIVLGPPANIEAKIVEESSSFKIFNEEAMVEYQIYEYKGIYDNYYLFQQGLAFYRVEMIGVSFKNEISGEIDFTTILKPGNQYTYMKTLNEFWFYNSYDYSYTLGLRLGEEQGATLAHVAYSQGYEAGSKLAEGLLESEYQRGFNNGSDEGYMNGYNQGLIVGFNNAYSEIVESTEYELGYNDGFEDGEKSKLVKNNEAFYTGIEKWLVPAIITVIVLGGIVSITALKRREQ